MEIGWILALIFGSVSAYESPQPDPNRIIDGVLINITQAPWTVSMHTKLWRDDIWEVTTFMCAGSIIGPNEVLTAAHCIPRNIPSWKIIIFRAGSENREKGGTVHYLDYVRHHPLHQTGDGSYDFVFVRVKEKFVFSNTVKPIEIRRFDPPSGSYVFLAGWGTIDPKWEPDQESSRELRAVNITMWSPDDCKALFNVNLFGLNHPEVVKCMKNRGIDSSKSGCRGDSGSPVVYQGKLAGILTGGASSVQVGGTDMICNAPTVVNVYNSPVAIIDWVEEMMKESQAVGKRR